MSKILYALARLMVKLRWGVVVLWLVAAALIISAGKAAGPDTYNDLSLPGTGSQDATNLLTKEFPPEQNGSSPVVFSIESGNLTNEPYKSAIDEASKALRALPEVYSVINPMEDYAKALRGGDDQIAYIPVLLNVGNAQLSMPIAQKVLATAKGPADRVGMHVAVGGPVGSELANTTSFDADKIGLLAAIIILTFTFGSLAAMGVPVVTAVFGLGIALSIVTLLEHVFTIPDVAPTLATMIGLGVGIDYALFMVTRHKRQVGDGMAIRESIARTTATSGGAVVFAGTTVVIAIASLGIAGIPIVTAMGYTSAIAVVIAVLAAVTLVPAIFALLGKHLFSLRLPKWLHPKEKDPADTFWAKAAHAIAGHPWRGITMATIVLAPMIYPFFSLEYGQPDVVVDPPSESQRQAYDLIKEGFGPGYNGPLLIAVELPSPAHASEEYVATRSHAIGLHETGSRLKREASAETRHFKTRAAALTAQGDELEAEAAPLQAEEARLEAQGEQLVRQGEALARQAAALESRKAHLEARGAALLNTGQHLEAKAEHYVAQLEQMAKMAVKVLKKIAHTSDPAKLARLVAKLERIEARAVKVAKELERTIEQGERVKSQLLDLERQGTQLERQGLRLEREATALEREKTRLKREGLQLQRESRPLQRKEKRLTRQGDTLKKQVHRAKGRAPLFRQRKRRLVHEGKVLKPELHKMLRDAGGKRRATDSRLQALKTDLAAATGVVQVSAPDVNDSGTASVLSVVPDAAPSSQRTNDLVNSLRATTIPPEEKATGLTVYVGGQTAAYIDLALDISASLPLVIGVVIALSFILLVLAFRSILVPAKAAAMNLLSVLAAFGVLTALFQWGWGLEFLGIQGADHVPIASYVPLMMFAVLFGLSMDYEVFLMSAIGEHYQDGMNPHDSIVAGLSTSARVITAAAMIMVSVFASFILESDPIVKQFGVGLSVAVAVDATIIRMLLVPSILALMGRKAWWYPKWLDKITPQLSLEGGKKFEAYAEKKNAEDVAKASAKATAKADRRRAAA